MSEREKIIKALECCRRGFCFSCPYNDGVDENVECKQRWADDTISLLKAQEAGWISVKDRLPEHGKRYLIYATSEGGKNHRITTAAYGGHFALSGRCAYWKVTHWMPLPEPPKEE